MSASPTWPLSESWAFWEQREEDKKLDKRWMDAYLRLYRVDSVETFWNAWHFTPPPGAVFKVVQGVGRPSIARGSGSNKRQSRVNGYAMFKEEISPFLESEIAGVRVNRGRWTLEDDVKDLEVADTWNTAWENLVLLAMSGFCDELGIINGVCISDKSKKGHGGRFRLEVWFNTNDSHACDAVCERLSQALADTTVDFGLRKFQAPAVSESRPGWFTTGPELKPFVEGALGVAVGGIERLPAGHINAAFAVHLAKAPAPDRTGGIVVTDGADLVFRLPGRRPGHIPSEVAATRFAGARCKLPVPLVLTAHVGDDTTLPYILCTRLPGVPLSSLWRSLPGPQRLAYLRQLVDVVVAMRQQPFPALGDFDEKMNVVSVVAAGAAGSGALLEPLVSHYQSALSARLELLQAHPRVSELSDILTKLAVFRDAMVPSLCGGYFGGFSLGHTRLRFKYILVDPSATTITGVLGWDYASSVCDEDGVSAVINLAETPEEVAFVAGAVKAAGIAALPGIENREVVRRVLGLCDKLIEFHSWYQMKAPAATAFFVDVAKDLSALLASATP